MCVLGALILGEYEFSGVTPYAVGLLFGLVVSEFVLEIAKYRHPVLGVVTGVEVGAALGWAGWISSGEGLRPFPTAVWAAIVIGAVSAGWRVGGGRGGRGPLVREAA
jgi:hypothetical protein